MRLRGELEVGALDDSVDRARLLQAECKLSCGAQFQYLRVMHRANLVASYAHLLQGQCNNDTGPDSVCTFQKTGFRFTL